MIAHRISLPTSTGWKVWALGVSRSRSWNGYIGISKLCQHCICDSEVDEGCCVRAICWLDVGLFVIS